jgi:hypothetical protein
MQGNISSAVFLANGYVDLGTWWCFTPFIGAGVGGFAAQPAFAPAAQYVPAPAPQYVPASPPQYMPAPAPQYMQPPLQSRG